MINPTRIFLKRIFLLSTVALILTAMVVQPRISYAAPQAQENNPPLCPGAADTIPISEPSCKDFQIVFMIDDSGSMGRAGSGNDPGGLRFQSLIQTVDQLAELYLNDVEARARVKPVIDIAAIHFATQVAFNSGWVRIAPQSRNSWEKVGGERDILINQKLINENIRNLVYNTDRDRRTDFRNPFRAAVDLLNAVEAPNAQGCPNRLVFLLTDGAPDEGQGELHRFTPPSRAKALLDAHFATVRELAAQIDSPIYVLAFRHSDRSYWDATKDYWRDGIATDALQVEVGNQGDTGELPNLLDFVNVKVEQQLVESTFTVPPYVETFEVSYEAPNARAHLEILDPQGNLLVPDGDKVVLTGEGTVDQVWKILAPLPGDYVFKPRDQAGEYLPGGKLSARFSYPNPGGMTVIPSSPHLQLFTRGDFRFKLQVADSNPQFQENYPPRFSVTLNPPDGKPQPMDLNPEEGEFTIPELLPVSIESRTVNVSVVTQDSKGIDCVLYQGSATSDVDPVQIVAQPVDPSICTPSGMPLRFPLTLLDANNNPTAISLPISWQVTSAHDKGSPVDAKVIESGSPGNFEFSLDTQQAGKIVTNVAASVEQAGVSYPLYEEVFETTRLVQDRSFAFELTGVETTADSTSVQFNRWFRHIGKNPYGQLLIGRRWFGWRGPQEIQVSGRFMDQETGESSPGIDRYLVELVPAGGGAAVASSDRWQAAGDGTYFVVFNAPVLGDYDVVITDQGQAQACTQFAPASGASITLIRHYWEYIIIILLIILILLLLILLILWLLCRRSKPLVLYLKEAGDLLDAPTRTGSHLVARLDHRHTLLVIEESITALGKIQQESGWLHIFAQVEGYVGAEYVCNDDGQAVLIVSGDQQLPIYAEANLQSESLFSLGHAAPVSVLEQNQNWLRIKVTGVGYVEASSVQIPKRQFRMRCRRRPLVVTGRVNQILRDAPVRTGSFEVAVLREDIRLIILEQEAQALDKIRRSAEWLLVQTHLTGFVETRFVNRESGDVVVVESGECVEVHSQADSASSSRLGLLHAAQVKVLGETDGWLEVAVLAQGYLPASQVSQPSKSAGSSRQDRPLIEAGPVETVECPSPESIEEPIDTQEPESEQKTEPDDLKLIEGIGPKVEALMHEKGIYTFAQIAAEAQAVGEIQKWLDDLGWQFLLPDTWPEQARLAEQAKQRGLSPAMSPEFNEYKAYLFAGRIPEPDDLERIDGIGPQVGALLKENGIKTYRQLAEMADSISVIAGWLEKEGLPARDSSTWSEQARLAAAGSWGALEEFKKTLRGKKLHDPGREA